MKFYSVSYIERNLIVLDLDFVNFVKKNHEFIYDIMIFLGKLYFFYSHHQKRLHTFKVCFTTYLKVRHLQ